MTKKDLIRITETAFSEEKVREKLNEKTVEMAGKSCGGVRMDIPWFLAQDCGLIHEEAYNEKKIKTAKKVICDFAEEMDIDIKWLDEGRVQLVWHENYAIATLFPSGW